MIELNEDFWSKRYQEGTTGWDLGQVSPPIKEYFDNFQNKDVRILIPGCGHAYEAEYLFRIGFNNVSIIDLVEEPLQVFSKRIPDFPSNQIIHGDFFELTGSYDFIVEQTMFCAINPELREEYAKKIYELLSTNGKLVGLLFDKHFEGGPPFGGSRVEYMELFSKYFSNVKITPCKNSIAPRLGSELFIEISK